MHKLLFVLPLAMLAGCDSGDVDMDNAKPSEVAQEMKKAGSGSFVRPGKWEQTVTLLEIDAPDMPPEAKQMMQKAMDKAQVHNVCLSKEQAERPREDFFTGADQNCTYEHFNWGGGKIDLKLICKHPQATQVMAMTGTYSPDNYVLTMTTSHEGGSGPGAHMVMKMKVDARRTGDCDGEDKVQLGN